MIIRKLFGSLFGKSRHQAGAASEAVTDEAEALWQANYDARYAYFEANVGPLPGDILKMLNMTGVWPGGGLFVIPAPRLGQSMSVYTTFGFTNPDMPTAVSMADFSLQSDGHRTTEASGTLARKRPAAARAGFAGYGYEILMVAPSGLQWPVNFLQWAVNAEIGHDAGLLARVEKFDGLTVEEIEVDDEKSVNVLIAKAQSPLPTGTRLPAGKMEILVATTIHADEMIWSQTNGRGALLKRLQAGGVGQVSIEDRPSVVQ